MAIGNLATVGGFSLCTLPMPTNLSWIPCWFCTSFLLLHNKTFHKETGLYKLHYLKMSDKILNLEDLEDIESEEDILVEKTLAIIKPDAFDKEYEILDAILRNGFFVLNKMKTHLSPEQASEFYEEHYNKSFFSNLVHYMSSAPIIVLVLGKQNAVKDWRDLIGPTNSIKARETHPTSLRAIYGKDGEVNAFHGSDSLESSKREIKFFFPNSIEDPIALDIEAKYYMQKYINPTLLKGLTALCHSKPQNPVVWLADWLTNNNPNKPKIQHAGNNIV